MSFTVLIPARLASSRLPNKPLADIGGQPMVVRVARRVTDGLKLSGLAARVVVACDSPLIMQACHEHDVTSVLTDVDHPSGSDRLAQACDLLGLMDSEIVVNVQGDEPLMDVGLVSAVAQLLIDDERPSMSTAAHPIDSVDEFNNPNVVKVVLDASGAACYFSRAPIPWWRDGSRAGQAALPTSRPLRHIGIYGYRAGFLRQFPRLAQSPLEILEALEQLRALWHGHRIAVTVTPHGPGPGVDTPEDLERVRKIIAG